MAIRGNPSNVLGRGQTALPTQPAILDSIVSPCPDGFTAPCGRDCRCSGNEPPVRPKIIYAAAGSANYRAGRSVWPLACRRLEEFPTINSTQLFEEPCAQFPGRFTPRQYRSLNRRIKRWREYARARGVVIEHLKHRGLTDKPAGRRADQFKDHWAEMVRSLEAQPDQTALELLVEFQARYPDRYHLRNLSALQRRVRVWRRHAAERLIFETTSAALRRQTALRLGGSNGNRIGNTPDEATGNKIT
jgi:hypothetical protein